MADENSPTSQGTHPHTCTICNRVFKSKATLTNHIRKFCKGPLVALDPEPSWTCDFCERPFPKLLGLQQHKRQAYPAEYNNEMETLAAAGRDYSRWTLLEVEEMAVAEIIYEGKNINMHLTNHVRRPLEAIKNKRRAEHYKGVTVRKRLELAENLNRSSSGSSVSEPSPIKKVVSPFLVADALRNPPHSSARPFRLTRPSSSSSSDSPIPLFNPPRKIPRIICFPPDCAASSSNVPPIQSPLLSPSDASSISPSSTSSGPFFGLKDDCVLNHLSMMLDLETGELGDVNRGLIVSALTSAPDLH